MSEIESYTSYWDEFLEKDLDSTEFKTIVSQDPILLKLYNFAFYPWSISERIQEYPFNDKISELKVIGEEDEDHLFDKRLYQGGETREWFNFFCKRYLLVKHTIKIKSELDLIYKQATEKEINEYVKWVFDNHLSQDSTKKHKETNGVQITERTTGIFFPERIIKDVEVDREKQIFNKKTGKYSKYKTKQYIRQEHYLKKPTKGDIERAFNELDIFSGESFQKYEQIMPNITYGGFHPDLDSGLSYKPEFDQYLIEFYHNGKPLTLYVYRGKKYTQFVFPVRKRYLPIMKAVVKKTLLKHDQILGDKESLTREAEDKLLKTLRKWNKSKEVRPAGFLASHFSYFQSGVFESQSTKAIPGDPRDKGTLPYCDTYCKEEKLYGDKLPCEFETIEGYCRDPLKKKPKLKAVIERPGLSFDDSVDDEGEEKIRLIDTWSPLVDRSYLVEKDDTKIVDIDVLKEILIEKLDPNNKDLFNLYYDKGFTQKKIAQKMNLAQSSVSTKIKKLDKELYEIIDNLRF